MKSSSSTFLRSKYSTIFPLVVIFSLKGSISAPQVCVKLSKVAIDAARSSSFKPLASPSNRKNDGST
jgi:hypothetical protein